jgi:hypothetical protein
LGTWVFPLWLTLLGGSFVFLLNALVYATTCYKCTSSPQP